MFEKTVWKGTDMFVFVFMKVFERKFGLSAGLEQRIVLQMHRKRNKNKKEKRKMKKMDELTKMELKAELTVYETAYAVEVKAWHETNDDIHLEAANIYRKDITRIRNILRPF